jgi:hypothetical protein
VIVMSGPFLAWLAALVSSPVAWGAVGTAVATVLHDWHQWPTALVALMTALAAGNANHASITARDAHAVASAAAGPNVAAAVKASKSHRKGPGR